MVKHAIIREGAVVNVIEYDTTPVGVPPGFTNGEIAVPFEGDGWSLPVSVGWVFVDGRFVDPQAPTDEERVAQAWTMLRTARNTELNNTDWTQMPDSPLSAGEKAAWATYRQQLRDLPATVNDPTNPVWPEIPE